MKELITKLCGLLNRTQMTPTEQLAALSDLEQLQQLIARDSVSPADLAALSDEGREIALTGFVVLMTAALEPTP